jgi:phospholipid/cholesterol/gamma-HCH transport system substrate-binding protein
MEDSKVFELKVGIFIMIGIAILFIIVFSIGDINLVKRGYHIKVDFNFVDGVGGSAPVRLAGVGVGQIDGLKIYFNEAEHKMKAQLYVWIKEGVKVDNEAVATINSLGFMGEKYLEIAPGAGTEFLKDGDIISGKDPASMNRIFEKLGNLTDSVNVIVTRLKNGEGTVGKLLTDDSVYKNLEAFTADIKANPWKLLSKPRGQ